MYSGKWIAVTRCVDMTTFAFFFFVLNDCFFALLSLRMSIILQKHGGFMFQKWTATKNEQL